MGADRALRKLRGGSLDMEWEEKIRKKIQTSMIVNRLIDYVDGRIKLEPAQVTAALGLMRKVLPDLVAAEFTSETMHKFVVAPETMSSTEEWLACKGNPQMLRALPVVEHERLTPHQAEPEETLKTRRPFPIGRGPGN
jgi:hypothetical protein